MLKKRILRSVLLVVLLIMGANAAKACSCSLPPVRSAYVWADAVFLGTVKKVDLLDPGKQGSRVIVTFAVERVWKGQQVTKTFEMWSIIETSFCEGFSSDQAVVGKRLLVFSNRTKEGYSTNICTLTGEQRYRQKEIKELGRGWLPD